MIVYLAIFVAHRTVTLLLAISIVAILSWGRTVIKSHEIKKDKKDKHTLGTWIFFLGQVHERSKWKVAFLFKSGDA